MTDAASPRSPGTDGPGADSADVGSSRLGDFEAEALEYLSENPGESFYGEEELGGKKYFVAVYPDRAVAEACWSCHNDHPNRGEDYPEFAKDDVMGGVLVRVPIR